MLRFEKTHCNLFFNGFMVAGNAMMTTHRLLWMTPTAVDRTVKARVVQVVGGNSIHEASALFK